MSIAIGERVWLPAPPFSYLTNRIGLVIGRDQYARGVLEVDFGEIVESGPGMKAIRQKVIHTAHEVHFARVSERRRDCGDCRHLLESDRSAYVREHHHRAICTHPLFEDVNHGSYQMVPIRNPDGSFYGCILHEATDTKDGQS